MSYDLYFYRRDRSAIAGSQFSAYFSARPFYSLNGDQAWYGNEDTGVYFSFVLGDDPEAEQEQDRRQVPAAATFNINYMRPHIFGLEAEPEVCAFVKAFDLVVFDPQIAGMGDGEYKTSGFFGGWNKGNQVGYRVLVRDEETASLTESALPTQAIEAYWRWNFARRELQSRFGERLFVPRIMFGAIGGQLLSMCAWPDGIPIALPRVDALFISREEFAPRRLLARKKDNCVALHSAAEAVLSQFPEINEVAPYRLLDYVKPPSSVISFVRSLAPVTAEWHGIPVDKVLNSEMLEDAKSDKGIG